MKTFDAGGVGTEVQQEDARVAFVRKRVIPIFVDDLLSYPSTSYPSTTSLIQGRAESFVHHLRETKCHPLQNTTKQTNAKKAKTRVLRATNGALNNSMRPDLTTRVSSPAITIAVEMWRPRLPIGAGDGLEVNRMYSTYYGLFIFVFIFCINRRTMKSLRPPPPSPPP